MQAKVIYGIKLEDNTKKEHASPETRFKVKQSCNMCASGCSIGSRKMRFLQSIFLHNLQNIEKCNFRYPCKW